LKKKALNKKINRFPRIRGVRETID
jgi:hypothetical protein